MSCKKCKDCKLVQLLQDIRDKLVYSSDPNDKKLTEVIAETLEETA